MEGFTLWFTGLPSSGKSTLAAMVAAVLTQRGFPVEVLDGDEVRAVLTKGLGFSREDRDENIRRIAWVAKVLSRNGAVAITAAISPYREAREAARGEIGRFVEIYVKCPVEVCIERDVKGLYRRALLGEIGQFTGVSDPYEEPLHPEVVVETDRQTPEASLESILDHLSQAGWLQRNKTLVRIPTYLAQRLSQEWGDEIESRIAEVLSRQVGSKDDGVGRQEREAILVRLRDLGYID